ncbi:MAG: hypothetical protein AAF587_37645 [Bacteroidota bacterium]
MKSISLFLYAFLFSFAVYSNSASLSGPSGQVSGDSTHHQQKDWPDLTLAGDVSFNPFNINLSVMGEILTHPNPGLHIGLGGGIFAAPVTPGSDYANYAQGLFLTTSLWTGKKNNHFEMQAGVALYHNEFKDDLESYFPIVSLGYRRQKPGKSSFFRVYLGTVGIGVGVGRSLFLKE